MSSVTECCQSALQSGSEKRVCVVGNINEKPLGILSGSLIKSSEQKPGIESDNCLQHSLLQVL